MANRRPAVKAFGSVVRAWLVVHDAAVVGGTLVALTGGFLLGADQLLPVPGQNISLPTWQLIPPAYAMVASLATVNRLVLRPETTALVRARLLWLLTVTASTAVFVAVVDLRSGLPSLAPATAVLVLLTFAASTLLGRMAVWIGAVAVLAVIANTARLTSATDPWHLLTGAAWVGVIGVCALGSLAYAIRGPRQCRTSDAPGTGIRGRLNQPSVW